MVLSNRVANPDHPQLGQDIWIAREPTRLLLSWGVPEQLIPPLASHPCVAQEEVAAEG